MQLKVRHSEGAQQGYPRNVGRASQLVRTRSEAYTVSALTSRWGPDHEEAESPTARLTTDAIRCPPMWCSKVTPAGQCKLLTCMRVLPSPAVRTKHRAAARLNRRARVQSAPHNRGAPQPTPFRAMPTGRATIQARAPVLPRPCGPDPRRDVASAVHCPRAQQERAGRTGAIFSLANICHELESQHVSMGEETFQE